MLPWALTSVLFSVVYASYLLIFIYVLSPGSRSSLVKINDVTGAHVDFIFFNAIYIWKRKCDGERERWG